MIELQKILDNTILQSFDTRPEVIWLQERYSSFMEENGLRSKRDADTLLYEKMYAAAPEQSSQVTKIRLWRTGHHIPSDREHIRMFGKALGLNQEEQLYLLQVYADRSDRIFDASSANSAVYQERRRIMDEMAENYLGQLHPAERIRFQVFTEDLLPSLRHIYFSHAAEYAGLPARTDSRHITRISSVSYGSEFLKNMKLFGEIPRKTMIRHILIMCIPFINERVISEYLSAFGYCPLNAGHTLTGGERFDAMLLEILALYNRRCLHKSPEECRKWLRKTFGYAERYLKTKGFNRLRPFYFKTLEKETL